METEMDTEQKNAELLAYKEKYYKRNFISFMLEGLFFTFAYTMFGTNTVIPDYVSHLTDDAVLLSLVSILYYGPVYLASIFSSIIGENTRSYKRTGIIVCFTQRFGLLAMMLASFLAGKTDDLTALLVFYAAFLIYTVANGLSTPIYSAMSNSIIHRDRGSFHGMYSTVGSAAGVVASALLTWLYAKYAYPMSFRVMFIVGFIFSLGSSFSLLIGLKESPLAVREPERKATLRDFPALFKKVIFGNKEYRKYTLIYVILGAAEFAAPFYIIRFSELEGAPANIVGIMAIVNLFAGMLSSMVIGKIVDKKGLYPVLMIICASGLFAAVVAFLNPGVILAYIAYGVLAFATNGIYVANTVAGVMCAKEGESLVIYDASSKLCAAPIVIAASFGSGFLANATSLGMVFSIAIAAYVAAFIISFKFNKEASTK